MGTNEDDLKLRVSSEGVEEASSAFSRLNNQLQQTVAFVQQQARQSAELGKASEAQGRGIRGLISQLGDLRRQYQQGVATGGQFSAMLPLMGAGISALLSPIGLAVIGLGALAAAIVKTSREAIATREELEKLSVATGLTARQSDVMIKSWELAGANSESVRMAMFRLSTQVESGGEMLGRYGIAVEKANGESKTQGELFEEIRAKLSGLNDSQRVLALTQIFGRGIASQLAAAMATTNMEMERYQGIAENSSNVTDEFMLRAKALQEAQQQLAMQTKNARLEFAEMIALPVATFFSNAAIGVMSFLKKLQQARSELRRTIRGALGFAPEEEKTPETIAPPEVALEKVVEPISEYKKQLADRDIQIDIDKRRQQLKTDESYFSQVAQLMTGSMQLSLALKQQTLEASIALADEEYTRRVENERRLSTVGYISPEKEQALVRERDQKIFEARQELRMLDLEREKAAVDDTTRIREDQLLREKAILDVRMKLIENAKNREQTMLELSFTTSARQILGRYESEQRLITESTSLKTRAIDDEMAALRRQAEQFQTNANLQREINNRLVGLQRDRVLAELDSNRQIMDSRKALADKLIAEAQREAGAAGNLTSRAIANLRARGRTSVSQSDISREIGNIQQKGAETAGQFAAGGRVKISAFEEAQATQGSFKDLASLGATITGAVNTMSSMMLKAFRGDLTPPLPSTVTPTETGFEPTSAGFGGGAAQPAISPALARAREEFRQARDEQLATRSDTGISQIGTAVSGSAAAMQGKITEAAQKAVEAIDFSKVFDTFSDALVRKLEFEAQRV